MVFHRILDFKRGWISIPASFVFNWTTNGDDELKSMP